MPDTAHQLLAVLAPLDDDALVPVRLVRRHLAGETNGGPAGAGPAGDLLDVEGIAQLLDRSVSTARALCAAGEIAAYKLRGREWRATRRDVADFLDAERERHGSPAAPSTTAPRSRRPRQLDEWRRIDRDDDEATGEGER